MQDKCNDAREKPPNLRNAEDKCKSCKTCRHYKMILYYCSLYKTYTKPMQTCDSFSEKKKIPGKCKNTA
jgi:hypothetical protein